MEHLSEIQRKELYEKIMEKYPESIAIVISVGNKNINLEKIKYLSPKETKIGKFVMTLRKNIINFDQNKCIFVYYNRCNVGVMPLMSETLEEVYEKADPFDGFLKFQVSM
jgi:hypothetical protein